MKTKIIGILICMLLIATALPAVGTIINDNITLKETTDDHFNLIQQIIGSSDNSGGWSEQDKMTASDGASLDYFGISVSLDGDYALIGANGDDSYKGSAYVFKQDGIPWVQEDKLTSSDGTAGDNFGYSASIDGDYALIGAFGDDSNKGSAYAFKRSGTTWTQEDKLTASDGTADDYFGNSVSIDGEYALIGASNDDNGRGSAYAFKRSGTTWTQEDKLTASDGESLDYFGNSVSIDGEYALIGASGDDSGMGSAYVFKRGGSSWVQEDKLTASDGTAGDSFGMSVSIDGEYALIGASADDTYEGSAYAFKRSGTTWTQEDKMTASGGEAHDVFGQRVSLDGDYALIGASGDDTYEGSAYVFKKTTPDLDCLGSLSWTDVSPGATVTGSFMVANVGDADSDLSWEIESYPTWGTWTFVPSSGTGLTPEMGTINIDVEVVAPDEENTDFSGEVKVVNSEDSNDYDTIPISLKTPMSHQINIHPQLQKILERFPNAFPILRRLLAL